MGENGHRRRSLILAGGGTKVAFQAGVLQVWLDEAQLAFDHADGASGGVFNLAMWCQGMSGTEIADNWRANRPLRAIEPNVSQWLKLPFAKSLFLLGRFRRSVLRDWGLDWPRIRSTSREATFNLYNFSRHCHVVLTPAEMDEDRLISAVSLPMWFPPVVIDGDTYIDAVFVTDANIEEAIRRGADEVWVIWTVSERGEWHDGFVAQYFQMIEAMANGQLRGMLARITRNNEAIAKREHAEFGRPIEVKILHAEVPLHYLLNFTRTRIAAAVELGVQAGRRWCHDEGIPLR
jgi:predicted patatin/cPLA2 family phospholipase